MVELLSMRAFAKRLTVDEKAVRLAKRNGLLADCVTLDNKIDWEKSKKNAWAINQSVIRPKAGVSRKKAIEKLATAAEILKKRPGKTVKKKAVKPNIKNEKKKILQTPQLSEPGKNQLPKPGKMDGVQDPVSGEIFTDDDLITGVVITKNMDLAEAMKLREIFGAALDQKKFQEVSGSLVKKTEVEKNLFGFGNQLKKALLSFPESVLDDVLAAPNKVEALNIMKMKINQLLTIYSNPENWNVSKI